ncbi:MAG: gliding motility protein GldN [Bacteroidota bacterium]
MRSIFTMLAMSLFFSSLGQNRDFTISDEAVEKQLFQERRVLPYAPVREADIMWEKKVWQVVDTREKMNHPFRYPVRPFFEILTDAISCGKVIAYSAENDRFETPLKRHEVSQLLFQSDTFEIVDPSTYEVTYQILKNDINPEEIVRYRIKEVWFFDSRTSTMKTRILGIAPIREVFREDGIMKYETPLFWVYYPHCRDLLAKEPVFNFGNDNTAMSWEDLFEMRYFSSYIYKESNVRDERIQDYLSGTDILVESNKVKQEILNFEQDLWSY